MKDLKQKLLIEQIDKKLKKFNVLFNHPVPETGWIKTIRMALKMSLRQFGERLKITSQGADALEKRESDKSISIKSMEEAARALNMKFVYGFIPLDGSIEKTIEKRAKEVAIEIVKTTSNNMALEDQQNTPERLRKAIKNKTQQLKYEMPRHLWD
jgi:predicted DNA-binding mobile mystery protein A